MERLKTRSNKNRNPFLEAYSYLSIDDGLTAAGGASGGFSSGFSSFGALTGAGSQATASGAGGGGTGAGTGAGTGIGAATAVGAAVVEPTVEVAFDGWVAPAAALGYERTTEFRHRTKPINPWLSTENPLDSVKIICVWYCCLNIKHNIKMLQNIKSLTPFTVFKQATESVTEVLTHLRAHTLRIKWNAKI